MQEREVLVEGLELMSGYHAERDGADINLVDSKGNRVARLSGRAVSKEPASLDQEWQDFFEALLMLARSHAIECEFLRERLQRLEERLGEVEAERDTSDRIAEDLYEFFSRTAQHVAKRKRAGEKELSDRRGGRLTESWPTAPRSEPEEIGRGDAW